MKRADDIAKLGAQSRIEDNHSNRRQKKLSEYAKEQGADLKDIMKKQLKTPAVPESRSELDERMRSQLGALHDTMSFLSQNIDRNAQVPPGEDIWLSAWRRAFVELSRERAVRYSLDGRMGNLTLIAQAGLVPNVGEMSRSVWEEAGRHLVAQRILLEPKDLSFLEGKLSENTWARTAIIKKIAKQVGYVECMT
jgi:hypothetical protein